jgi:hypothetical protein
MQPASDWSFGSPSIVPDAQPCLREALGPTGQAVFSIGSARSVLSRTVASSMPSTANAFVVRIANDPVVLPVNDAPTPLSDASPNHACVPTARPMSKWVLEPVHSSLSRMLAPRKENSAPPPCMSGSAASAANAERPAATIRFRSTTLACVPSSTR